MSLRVDWRSSCSLTGTVVKWLAIALVAPLSLAVFDGDDPLPFVGAILVALAVGIGLERLRNDRELGHREAFLMVALTWLGVSAVGAIPFVLAGTGTLAHPVNAMFESTSGVTTTGATVIETFDAHPRSVLLWRQVLQWLGGLGILIVAIGLLSHLMVGGAQLMETETQTRTVRKLHPHIADTARLIWGLYVGLTVLAAASLYALHVIGLAPNMDLFNAVSHALSSVATAGFSPEANSIGAFSPAVQWTLIPFMILGATNFVLLYYVVQGDYRRPLESEEFRFYIGVIASVAVVIIVVLLIDPGSGFGASAGSGAGSGPSSGFGSGSGSGSGTSSGSGFRPSTDLDGGLEPTIRHGLFNVVSLVTTTGYASTDFDLWSPGAKLLLFLCMFVGGMAGSTTCSIKSLRWLVILKALGRNLFTAVHPEAVRPIRLDTDVVPEDTVRDVFSYVLLAIVLFFLLTVVIVVDAARMGTPVDEFDALGAAASIFLNIGPAFGIAGPFENYAAFPTSTRLVMIVMMWIGRIEIIPVLVLLTPAFWRS